MEQRTVEPGRKLISREVDIKRQFLFYSWASSRELLTDHRDSAPATASYLTALSSSSSPAITVTISQVSAATTCMASSPISSDILITALYIVSCPHGLGPGHLEENYVVR